MTSNNQSSLLSLLLRKLIINPQLIIKTYHQNSMDITEKSLNEVSTQCQNSLNNSIDEQSQLSQSKHTQTNSPISSIKNPQQYKYRFINPYSIIDRVNQGEQFIKFLYKQNLQLHFIYSTFIQNLQKYSDHFFLSLQQQHHSLYGIYRRDLIRYMIILQDQLNELRIKLNILQEANKNFVLFQKHFHKMTQSKSQLEHLLIKHHKYLKQLFHHNQSVKYEQQFFEVYERSYIQLRTIEQQRLLAIREQMRFAMNLTMTTSDHHHLFSWNNFDDLLNSWDNEHLISINNWSHFPRRSARSEHDNSLILLDEIKEVVDEYYNHRSIISNNRDATLKSPNDDYIKRIDSIASNLTHSHI